MMLRVHIDSALVAAALVVALLSVNAEASSANFWRAYGGPDYDIGFCAQQTTDGGYIATGFYGVLTDSGFGWLIKTDEHGDTVWTRKLGGAWVQQTTDSGFVALGGIDSGGSGPGGIWLVKTDSSGDTLWSRIYEGNNAANMVEQTADGGYVMTGTASYSSQNGGDVHILKTDAGGDTLWTRTFGGSRDDQGLSIQQTSDQGYIIVAYTISFGAGNQKIWLIKTDSIGDTLWTRLFGGDSTSSGGWAQQTTDGGYFVAGWTTLYSFCPRLYLIKTDSVGDTLWTRTIGMQGHIVEGFSGQQVKDGGYIIVGGCQDTITGNVDVYLARTDANGDTLWTRTFGGPSYDCGQSVRQTADGGYIICGQTYSFGAGGSDFYLIKTDANGNVAIAEPKPSPSRRPDISLTCEPNPFRASTLLHLTARPLDLSATYLRIYDAQGRLVRTLAASQATETMWDGRNDAGQLLPSGTYLVRFDAAGEHASTRVVLQR
jgi:hypothetical protein